MQKLDRDRKTSAVVGPSVYEAWTNIQFLRKDRLLAHLTDGKVRVILRRKHDYATLNEIEVAIMTMACIDAGLKGK